MSKKSNRPTEKNLKTCKKDRPYFKNSDSPRINGGNPPDMYKGKFKEVSFDLRKYK